MERHFIQQQILNTLQKVRSGKFGEINEFDHSSDQFNFHLKKLLGEGLISKSIEGEYSLTGSGLEAAGRLDFTNSMLIEQPKIGISVGIFRNNDTEMLVLKRTREPSFGQIAWFDRKMRTNSSIENEIQMLLKEETGLSSDNYKFNGLAHIIRKTDSKLEIDIVSLNYKIQDPTGELIENPKDGEIYWEKVDTIKNLPEKDKITAFNERIEAYLKEEIVVHEFIT